MSDHPRIEQQALRAMEDLSLSEASTSSGGIDGASLKAELVATITELNENMPRNLGCPYRPLELDDMPLECLEAIFDQIPMQQLLAKHRLVCRRWRDLTEDMCRRKGKTLCVHDCDSYSLARYLGQSRHIGLFADRLLNNIKRSNIIIFRFNLYNYGNYHLDIHSEKFYEFVLRLCPCPTTLILRLWLDDSFHHLVTHLLPHWSSHLITFYIAFHSRMVRQLGNFINTCTSLRRLDLLALETFSKKFTINASILKALEHFSYDGPNFEGLHHLFASDSQCTRLWLQGYPPAHSAQTIRDCVAANPRFLSKITHLYLNFHSNLVSHLSAHFGSLKVLELYDSLAFGSHDQFDVKLFQALAPLTNLNELKLHQLVIGNRVDNLLPPVNYIPLSSVKKFYFNMDTFWRQDGLSDEARRAFYPTLAAYFPNLEELVIEKYRPWTDLEDFEPFMPLFPRLKKHSTPKQSGTRLDFVFLI